MKIDQKMADTLSALYHRWQDEGKYEGSAEYKRVLNEMFPDQIIQMTMRPFRLFFRDGTGVRVKANEVYTFETVTRATA